MVRKPLNTQRTRQIASAILIAMGMIVTLPASAAVAQQVTDALPRAVPAPWRPAFGPVNTDAATQSSSSQVNGAGGATPVSPAVDLTPPTAPAGPQGWTRAGLDDDRSRLSNIQTQPNGAAADRASASATSNAGLNALNGSATANGSAPAFTRPPDISRSASPRSLSVTQDPSVVPAAAQVPINSQRFTPPSNTAPATRVTRLLDTLPNTAGQIWREYDISPYTSQIKSVANPQQAILDWVLRETGTEMWFNQPLGVLSANKNQLRVYHTPEIHGAIKPIVDRFIHTQGQQQDVEVNLITIGNPNWRSQAYSILQSIDVQSTGVEAWLVSKENAALLRNGLSRRADYREHSSGRLTAPDGQAVTLKKTKPVQFVRNLRWSNGALPGGTSPTAQPEMDTIEEGYRLELSVLSSLDNRTIEAIVGCEVDQVERLTNVKVSVPDAVGNPMQMNLQVPQMVSWRLKERFRWPADQVLVLSCGVVANPDPKVGNRSRVPLMGGRPDRAEALLFIDYRGPTTGASVPQTASDRLVPVRR